MNDFETLLAMLKKAGATFEIEDNNKTIAIYGRHDNIITFEFDENGNAIKAD